MVAAFMSHKFMGHGKPTPCGKPGGTVAEVTHWANVDCPDCLAARPPEFDLVLIVHRSDERQQPEGAREIPCADCQARCWIAQESDVAIIWANSHREARGKSALTTLCLCFACYHASGRTDERLRQKLQRPS